MVIDAPFVIFILKNLYNTTAVNTVAASRQSKAITIEIFKACIPIKIQTLLFGLSTRLP